MTLCFKGLYISRNGVWGNIWPGVYLASVDFIQILSAFSY